MRARRLLVAVIAAFAALLALPVAAQALSVKVVDLNGDPHVVDLADLQGQEDTGDGERQGFSLNKILEEAGTPFNYYFLTVGRPGQSSVQLTKDQVRSSEGTPFVYESGSSVGFIWQSPPDGADYSFAVPDQIVVTLADESPIGIKLGASETKIEAGDTVDFKAVIAHPPNLTPDISWTFGDGKTADEDTDAISHKFKSEGTFNVVVSAKDPYTGVGPSASVEIQVGEKKEKDDQDRDGGGDDDRDDAPESGTSDGTGGSYGGTGTGTGSPGTAVPPVAPGVTPTAPSEDQPRDDRRDEPDRQPAGGAEVSGEVLQDGGAVVEVQERKPEEEEKRATLRSGDDSGGFGIPGAALGGMTVLALLGVGALGQAGKIRLDSVLWHANRLVGR